MSWNPYVQDRTDLNDLLDWLEDLPDETDPEYETRVGQINSTVELLEEIASDPDRDPVTTFAAFYRLAILLRRRGDFDHFGNLMERYEKQHGHHPLFSHQKAMFLTAHADLPRLKQGLMLAHHNLKALPRTTGALHLFAETVAKIGELYRKNLPDRHMATALRMIERALNTDPSYAKYYATRARILTLLGRYDEAYNDVHKAVSLEPSDGKTYYLRISQYQMILHRASLKKELGG